MEKSFIPCLDSGCLCVTLLLFIRGWIRDEGSHGSGGGGGLEHVNSSGQELLHIAVKINPYPLHMPNKKKAILKGFENLFSSKSHMLNMPIDISKQKYLDI